MNPFIAAYLGAGVFMAGLACIAGLAYLSGRVLALAVGQDWSKASTEDKGFLVGRAFVGVVLVVMLLTTLGLVGYEIATGFGWVSAPL